MNTENRVKTEDEARDEELVRILDEHPNLLPVALRLVRELTEQNRKEQEVKA